MTSNKLIRPHYLFILVTTLIFVFIFVGCGRFSEPESNIIVLETLPAELTATLISSDSDADSDDGVVSVVTPAAESLPTIAPTAVLNSESASPSETESESAAAAVATPVAGQAAFEPYLEPSACPFTLPDHPGVVDCGRIHLPENRSKLENGRTVSIAVAIFRALDPDQRADPIIYLEGGPGGKSLDTIQYSYDNLIAPYVQERDFILFDQRGVGYSEPALDCPELLELELELLDDDIPEGEANQRYLDTLQVCRDRLAGAGVDLVGFNSAENAADVEDIRRVLGYETLNLYGISYGTRLALTVMRDYPAGVRSVILDSPVPLQGDLQADIPAHIDGAFRTFFDGCAADAACVNAYPELEETFYRTVKRLDANPALFPITYFFTGERYNVLFRGEDLIGILFQSLYSNEIFPLMPRVIAEADAENYDLLAQIYANFLVNSEFLSIGMYYSVNCQEEFAFSDQARVASESTAYPQLVGYLDDWPVTFAGCDIWDVGVADAVENDAVVSDVPTLIMAGQYDPITPDRWARLIESDLTRDTYILFPAVGHGVTTSDQCGAEIANSFFNNPEETADLSCAELVPPPSFALPAGVSGNTTVQNGPLIPFEADFFGVKFSGVRPENWQSLTEIEGTFLRGSNALDATFLQHQALSTDLFPDLNSLADAYLSQLADDTPLLIGPRSDVNEREWLLYEFTFQQVPAVGALTEADDGQNSFLVFITYQEEAEKNALLEEVLYPALDAMRIIGP